MKKLLTTLTACFILLVTTNAVTNTANAYSSCGDSAGNDGYYGTCLNDTVTHQKSHIDAQLVYINSQSILLKLKNAETEYLFLNKGESKEVRGNYDHIVKYEYNYYNSNANTATIKISTPFICGDSAGYNGTYTACLNDSINHYSSKATLKVLYFDDDKVVVETNNPKSKYSLIYKDKVQKIPTFAGYLETKYTYTSDYGVNLNLKWVPKFTLYK